MSNAFYQIVITLWLGLHPVNITLPKIYNSTDYGECDAAADAVAKRLVSHERWKFRIRAACEGTDKREL